MKPKIAEEIYKLYKKEAGIDEYLGSINASSKHEIGFYRFIWQKINLP
jgi:hypothetical protein